MPSKGKEGLHREILAHVAPPILCLVMAVSDQGVYTGSVCCYEPFIHLANRIFTPQNAAERNTTFIYLVSPLISESPYTYGAGD